MYLCNRSPRLEGWADSTSEWELLRTPLSLLRKRVGEWLGNNIEDERVGRWGWEAVLVLFVLIVTMFGVFSTAGNISVEDLVDSALRGFEDGIVQAVLVMGVALRHIYGFVQS